MRSLAIVALALLPLGSFATEKPNIIIFLADDLGWGDLGCFGNKIIQTPNLDAFAKEGVRLTNCYSASAVCSPSRSAILTGRTPHRNGVYTWIQEGAEVHLRTSELALPKILKSAGYSTCHVGKWHLNGLFNNPKHPQPNDHGYDYWLGTQNNAAPSHKNPTNFVRNGQPVGALEGFSAPLVVGEAIDWLKTKRDPKKPFFLAVWTHEPHLPIESDPEFQKPYAKIENPDVRQHHGNVTQLDHAFGTLNKALSELKLTDNTIVYFTSDNGPEGPAKLQGRTRGSAGELRGRKRAMYEGGIRVPGLARFPGRIPAGSVCDIPVIGSDLYPTMIQLAGEKLPDDRTIDGVDISPVLMGQAKTLERKVPLYWRLNMAPGDLHVAMRVGDWKILSTETLSRFELYNLKNDISESRELSKEQPEKLNELKKQLKTVHDQIEAEGPDWWKRLSPNGGGLPKKK
jgi:arylsulfatase A